jgi:hypothetical protein
MLAGRAFDLLKEPSMLFVILKARTPDEIVKGVRVVEEVGRLRLRRWEELEAGSEMHQSVAVWELICPSTEPYLPAFLSPTRYLVEEKPSPPPTPQPALHPMAKQPPRTINLNDVRPAPPSPPTASSSGGPKRTQSVSQPWDKAPPQAMSIYLSKIVLPDLQPRAGPPSTSGSSHASPPPPARNITTRPSATGRPPPSSSSSSQQHPRPTQPQPPPPPPTAGPSPPPRPHPSVSTAPPLGPVGSDVAGNADSRISRLMDGFGRLSTGLRGSAAATGAAGTGGAR